MSLISPQLQLMTVQCHKKGKVLHKMTRGSGVADVQFAYFTPFGSASAYRYRWSTEEWGEELPQPPFWNCGLVIIDGRLTAVGGWNGFLRTKTLFTLQQGEWVRHYPPMNTERSSPAVVSTPDGNRILVIGGRDYAGNWTTTVELFHVERKSWYNLTNLPQALIQPSATICGNQIHIIGCDGDGYSSSLQGLLSSDQLTWTPLPQLPVTWSTVTTLGGQLVIVGGEQGESKVDSIHQLMDGKWLEIGSMSRGRSKCLLVTPSPNKMMIVGGYGVEECIVV